MATVVRYALRLVPVDAVGPANLRTIEERVPGLCEGFFAPGTGREIEGKTVSGGSDTKNAAAQR